MAKYHPTAPRINHMVVWRIAPITAEEIPNLAPQVMAKAYKATSPMRTQIFDCQAGIATVKVFLGPETPEFRDLTNTGAIVTDVTGICFATIRKPEEAVVVVSWAGLPMPCGAIIKARDDFGATLEEVFIQMTLVWPHLRLEGFQAHIHASRPGLKREILHILVEHRLQPISTSEPHARKRRESEICGILIAP